MSSIRRKRGRPVTNSVVLGKNDPTFLADLCDPIFVSSVLGKVVVVDFYFYSALAKFSAITF
ncbi:MAG TPA: hypothetical protein VJ864_02950 [Candidatus Binatia bacterium]|nr:hypothetical protein [Candidatus Binatia bacterium]